MCVVPCVEEVEIWKNVKAEHVLFDAMMFKVRPAACVFMGVGRNALKEQLFRK